MIRSATADDYEKIIDLLEEAREASPHYRKTAHVRARVSAFIDHVVNNPKGEVFVDDDITGVLMCEVLPDWTTVGYVAFTHVIYAQTPNLGVKLIKHFQDWAHEWPQVCKVQVASTFGDSMSERTDKLFQRLGFEPIGRNYVEVSK